MTIALAAIEQVPLSPATRLVVDVGLGFGVYAAATAALFPALVRDLAGRSARAVRARAAGAV